MTDRLDDIHDDRSSDELYRSLEDLLSKNLVRLQFNHPWWTAETSSGRETKLDDAAMASIYAHFGQEEKDMERGKKGDKFERELYDTIRQGDRYLAARMTEKERVQLLSFVREVYREDRDIQDPHEWGILIGIGLALKGSLE